MRQCLIPALGWASLVVVLDWDTKKVVGWDLSVNDSQPPATGCMAAMSVLGIEPVFTSSDTPKGNADTERLRRTSKEELLWLQEFTRLEEARDVLSRWMTADFIPSAPSTRAWATRARWKSRLPSGDRRPHQQQRRMTNS
jgi:putative transposase